MQELAERLSRDYYDLLEILSGNVDAHTSELLNQQIFTEYVRHSKYLVEEVRGFVNERREVYIPYVFDLEAKNTTGHNCSTCSGRCDMQHSFKLAELETSQKKIYDIANRVLALLAEKAGKEANAEKLIILRNEAALLRNKISQLIEHEEIFLIPRIREAQKNINAHS